MATLVIGGYALTVSSQVSSVNLNKVAAKTFASNSLSTMNAAVSIFEQYATQTPLATELRVISQPSGSANIDYYGNYIYRTDNRRETYIYNNLALSPLNF